MKSVICFIVNISFFLQAAGCYTIREIPKDKLNNQPGDIELVTKDSSRYFFEQGKYSVRNSNLYGTGIRYSNQTVTDPIIADIAMDDILYIKGNVINDIPTVLIITAVAAVIAGIVWAATALPKGFGLNSYN
jgi:hypothetical protein